MSLVASFAPSLRSGANDATRATNKLYALQKSCDGPIQNIYLSGSDVHVCPQRVGRLFCICTDWKRVGVLDLA